MPSSQLLDRAGVEQGLLAASRLWGSQSPRNLTRSRSAAWGLLALDPVESGGEAEDAHEAGGGLLIAGRHRPPLFQPRPEPFDVVAIGVNPVWTGDLLLVALRGDGRTRAQGPDVLAKGVTAETPVRHHPLRHAGQALQERDRMGQLMRLPGSQDEGHRASEPVRDHAGLGSIAATRAAKRFTLIALLAVGPLFF